MRHEETSRYAPRGRCTECDEVPDELGQCACTGYGRLPGSEWDYDPYQYPGRQRRPRTRAAGGVARQGYRTEGTRS